MLWYGLYLRSPWVSFVVVGALLVVGGVFLAINTAKTSGKVGS